MQEIIEKYKKDKCSRCINRNKKLEEDKCEIKIFQYNDYRYCKCCNMSDDRKEIKEKVI